MLHKIIWLNEEIPKAILSLCTACNIPFSHIVIGQVSSFAWTKENLNANHFAQDSVDSRLSFYTSLLICLQEPSKLLILIFCNMAYLFFKNQFLFTFLFLMGRQEP